MALPLRGESLGNPDDAVAIAVERGALRPDALQRYAVALWVRCAELGIRADIAFSQADLETGDRQTGTGFRSDRWVKEGNPAGLGIVTGMPDSTPGREGSPEWWADVHAIHLGGYAGIDPGPELRALDFRWQAMIDAGYFGIATTVDDLDGRWATSRPYGSKIEARWQRYNFPAMDRYTPDAGDGDNEQEAPMGYKAHDWSHIGFPGGKVYLPDWIPVEIKIIPSSVAGWTSGQKLRGQTSVTWHDTGNPNSSASSEWSWAAGGGRAGINSPGSYNGIWDRNRIIIAQRFDELVGHAGVPSGNRTSWAFEQAYGPGFDVTVGVALFGGIIAAMGWSVDTALRKHQDWSGKWCPAQILNRGMWPQVQAMVAEAARKARAAAGGVDPSSPIAVGATVATTVALNLRGEASTSAPVLTTLPAGTELVVSDGPTDANGYTWWQVEAGGEFGWVAEADTSGTVPYLAVTKPAPDEEEPETPAYAKPLAIAELAPYVGRPITPMPATIALESGIAVPVFDRVRAVRDTPRRQQVTGDARVGPDIREGETFDVSFLLIGEGYEPTYLSPWLTRITAADCEVISDAPKDIPAAAPEAA